MEECNDLSDNLPELTQFLHEFTGATGVYIGKLEHPRLKIEDKDNDRAHIDREAPKVVKYIHATPISHEYMIGKILKPGQGLSHAAFQAPEEAPVVEGGEPVAEGEGAEDGEKAKAANSGPPRDELMDLQYHIYVPEVVREPQMHFYRVPRLGAYMAIPLEYNSCLTEKALDQALNDYNNYIKAV